MTEEKRMEKGATGSSLSGLRYLRVTRGQKERKRKRLEKNLSDVLLDLYRLNKEIKYRESEEAKISKGAVQDV